MKNVTRLRISRLNFSVSGNFNNTVISSYYNIPNIPISSSNILKCYNAIILNPVMNNY